MTKTCNNTLKPGDVLNQKWIILEFIDKGGMGEVYRAHQSNLKRDVAIKVISKEWLDSLDEGDEEAETLVQRFKREVQSMAQIRHPNVLQVYDNDSISVKKCDTETIIEYIVMEYVAGGSLRSTMSEEGFYPESDAFSKWIKEFFLPVLSGVEALHDSGIVHRDLKPENILIDHGNPKIADFGLSRSQILKPITQSIDVKGSLHYMSPEHFFDFKRADHRSDVYSLGKILFETVEGKITTGTIPFKNVNLAETESSFFKQLDRIISEATAEDLSKRTGSVKDLRDQLLELVNDDNVARRSQTPHKQQNIRFFSKTGWIWTGIITATLSVFLMTIWHLLGEPSLSGSKQHRERIVQTANNYETTEYTGIQHLIPGGRLKLPTSLEKVSGQDAEIASFYMDEFLVNNQQFVDFLNHNISKIKLENGVVKGDGANWYLLGEIHEGYEPIVYRKNKFHVSKPDYTSNPVLRVTGYGASAFADFFDRRLPSEVEWLYATMSTNQKDRTNNKSSEPALTIFDQNGFGIRALNKGVGEWGERTLSSISKDKLQDNHFVVMGVLDLHPNEENLPPPVISRFPWEGFEEVGFRTVKSASTKKQSM